jgi:hypothetical protein
MSAARDPVVEIMAERNGFRLRDANGIEAFGTRAFAQRL